MKLIICIVSRTFLYGNGLGFIFLINHGFFLGGVLVATLESDHRLLAQCSGELQDMLG